MYLLLIESDSLVLILKHSGMNLIKIIENSLISACIQIRPSQYLYDDMLAK